MKPIIVSMLASLLLLSLLSAKGQGDGPSLATLKAAVEAQPDSFSVHERYIKAFEKSIPGMSYKNADSVVGLLEPQYTAWMQQFPKSATVPFAMGNAYANMESPKAKPFLLKAVALDPSMVKAYEDLEIDAERWGDFDTAKMYLKKAMDVQPQNPDYVFGYAYSFKETDPAKYRQLSLEMPDKFPNSERSAQALYWLAFNTTDLNDKVAIYEELKSKFPPDKFSWSGNGMSEYFDVLLLSAPAKALVLAQSMVRLITDTADKKEWVTQAAVAEKVATADKLLNEHKASDAIKVLAEVKVKWWSSAKEGINLLKARALDATGNTMGAYDSLLVFFAKEPSDETRKMMIQYAAKLGKDSSWVDAGIRGQWETTAQQAPIFKLAAYLTNDSISLADYRGKVVLLTFWFPGCGPCRGEFPHFQTVLSKFKGQDISYVGINVVPGQDPYVVPFMKSSGYGFTPLRDNDGWSQKAYKVRGEPTNFLIDQTGRIIFSGFMIQNEKAQRMLELMIGSLLAQKG